MGLFLKQIFNFAFRAICRSQFPYPWYQKAKVALRMSLRNKKKQLIILLKGFIKQLVIKQNPAFPAFLLSLAAALVFFALTLSKR